MIWRLLPIVALLVTLAVACSDEGQPVSGNISADNIGLLLTVVLLSTPLLVQRFRPPRILSPCSSQLLPPPSPRSLYSLVLLPLRLLLLRNP